ncbi:lytic transglycosylase domain-containing protein [Azoarcus sp. L1K30]|uniref:lytic transglycosylase domain-containing protein n=1 Tax=Azoarcus sp. L1K30 TaxID=2820277 RepID=UPI001B81897C|nr:lytic transglycosylase domain-containing protein [Azoarcus sp. L1K30]MBR0567330.1 lytic transglycosylase domain-containing protein [Azoarcus sp. L1K30]
MLTLFKATTLSMPARFRLLMAALLLSCAFPGAAGQGEAREDAPAWTDEPPALARMLEAGFRAERNRLPDLAAASYCAAARYGSIEAQYQLGRLLLNRHAETDTDHSGLALLALAARQGHLGAQAQLDSNTRMIVDAELPPCLLTGERAALPDNGEAVPFDVVERFIASLPGDRRAHARLVQRLAPRYGVDPRLALAIARTESNFDADARSSRNAQGLMQLIPDTAERFGVRDTMDPEQNVRGGLAYLRWLLRRFDGDVLMTAAAYNAGEGAVERHGGVPPFDETREYVRRIMHFYRASRHAYPDRSASTSNMQRQG